MKATRQVRDVIPRGCGESVFPFCANGRMDHRHKAGDDRAGAKILGINSFSFAAASCMLGETMDLFSLYARYDGPLPREGGFATGRRSWETLLSACLRRQREKRIAAQDDREQAKRVLGFLRGF